MVASTDGKGNLARLFESGTASIATSRSDNLFKDLEARALTAAEEGIITQRVALQRRMLEEYEKKEGQRKVRELMDTFPGLGAEEATAALQLYHGREDDAAAALACNPALLRKVRAMCGMAGVPRPASVGGTGDAPARTVVIPPVARVGAVWSGRQPRTRLPDDVFVGSFRGAGPWRGWERFGRVVAGGHEPASDESDAEPLPAAARAAATAPLRPSARKPRTLWRSSVPHTRPAPLTDDGGDNQEYGHLGGSGGGGLSELERAWVAAAVRDEDRALRAERRAQRAAAATEASRRPAEDTLPRATPGSSPAGPVADTGDRNSGSPIAAAGGEAHIGHRAPQGTHGPANIHVASIAEVKADAGQGAAAPSTGDAKHDRSRSELASAQGRGVASAAPREAHGGKASRAASVCPKPRARAAHQGAPQSPAYAAPCGWVGSHGAVSAPNSGRGVVHGASSACGDTKATSNLEQIALPEQGPATGSLAPPQRLPWRGLPVQRTASALEAPLPMHAEPPLRAGSRHGRSVTQEGDAKAAAAASQHARQELGLSTAAGPSAVGFAACRSAPVMVGACRCSTSPHAAPDLADTPMKARTRARRRADPPPPLRAAAHAAGGDACAAAGTSPGPLSSSSPGQSAGEAGSPATGAATPEGGSARARRLRRAPLRLADLPEPGKRKRSRVEARLSTMTEDSPGSKLKRPTRCSPRSPAGPLRVAVPAHKPRLGRVKRCSSKQVELVAAGTLCLRPGWHNHGYIFPDGFVTRTVFRSSVALEALCVHECAIVGAGGAFWPAPTFRVTAADRPGDPLEAKSATGCWNAILARINAEIDRRRRTEPSLPPPPKTAIAGPEYFGLTHPAIVARLEALDPERRCALYWHGKQDRLAYGQVHGVSPDRKGPAAPRPLCAEAMRPGRGPAPSGARGRGSGARRRATDDASPEADEAYQTNRWSAVDRATRARRRRGADPGPIGVGIEDGAGGDGKGLISEPELLPGVLDPVTLEPVVTPAISPAGHVMGLATWAAVLAEQGKCPFTQAPLRREQITVLTAVNIERYRDRMILP